MATYTFTLTLEPVPPGDAATLQWVVAGSQQLYLNDIVVPTSGSQRVTPNTTTAYALKIVMPDGTTRAPLVTFSLEEAVAPSPVATRPPTVTLTPENRARLQGIRGRRATTAVGCTSTWIYAMVRSPGPLTG